MIPRRTHRTCPSCGEPIYVNCIGRTLECSCALGKSINKALGKSIYMMVKEAKDKVDKAKQETENDPLKS